MRLAETRLTNSRLLADALALMRRTHFNELPYVEGLFLSAIIIEILAGQIEGEPLSTVALAKRLDDMPRTSVRDKVTLLVSRGLVRRVDDHLEIVEGAASDDMTLKIRDLIIEAAKAHGET